MHAAARPQEDVEMILDQFRNRHRSVAEALDSVAALTRRAGLSGRQAIVWACVLVPVVVAAVAASIWLWNQFSYGSLDRHGRIALAIGVIASLGLGIGLMGLVFYSSHHGYDQGTRRP
jgi:hypothetical protein